MPISRQEPPPNAETLAQVSILVAQASSAIHKDVAGAHSLLSRALRLLAEPAPATPQPAPDPVSWAGRLAAWQARRVAEHIDVHLTDPISVGDLAAIARLSRTHFSRAFRGSFGVTPHAYILLRRVAMAKQLMAETDLPLAEIACACGLCDQAHLSRLFLRCEGLSPMRWRRALRAAPDEGQGRAAFAQSQAVAA